MEIAHENILAGHIDVKKTEEGILQLQSLLKSHDNFFSDIPEKTLKIEHKIKFLDKDPIRSKPYPLPYALRQELKNEITEKLNMGIIWKSSLPHASMVVIVKKKMVQTVLA